MIKKKVNNMNKVINIEKELTLLSLEPKEKKIIIDLTSINNRIKNEICNDTINKLKDSNLLDDYKKCISVKNKIKTLSDILEKHKIDNDKKESIINEYYSELIPPGTKGVIRGNKFNSIVKNAIENMKLDKDRFEICFEKDCKTNITSEKPDWYILEKKTNKVIIGMNQLDLWSGGQQINRGSKYLIDNKHNTKNSKLLCVVCNQIKISSNKNKAYKLFETGFSNDTLCYLKNMGNIINKFFELT